jgi:hypothetical protein
MAARKRRSCTIGATGPTQDQQNEQSGPLEVATSTSVRSTRSRRQNGAANTQPNANPPSESDTSISYAPLS